VNGRVADRINGCSLQPWRYWLPVCAYAGYIFYLSSLSHPEDEFSFLRSFRFLEGIGDKLVHLVEYGILGILFHRAFRYAGGAKAAHSAVWLAILAASTYGLTDELHQAFVPLRVADPLDLIADTLGAFAGVVGWHLTAVGLRRLRPVFASSSG
jgi:hypothetical protein